MHSSFIFSRLYFQPVHGFKQGGMMEEWHQKLHNNSSADDIVICQALIEYIKSGLDISAYWSTLQVVPALQLSSFLPVNSCTFLQFIMQVL